MFSNKKDSDDCEFPKILAACFKESQTSNSVVTDPSRSSIFACDSETNKNNKNGVKVFEFNHIIQNSANPNSVTLIRDKFVEEVKEHSNSSVDEGTANRYKYCREVIKPYLKSYPPDCPRSKEQLIQDVLDSVHEDFPDYQPCFEGHDERGYSAPKIDLIPPETTKTNNSHKVETSTPKQNNIIDVDTCYCAPPVMKNEEKDPCAPKKKPKCEKPGKSSSRCPPPIEVCEDSPASDDTPPPIACKSPSGPICKADKKPTDVCGEETEEDECQPKKDKKPARKGSAQSVSSRKSSSQAMDRSSNSMISKFKYVMDAHNETIKTIRVAAEDIFEKVYVATKDAVAEFTTKSCAQIIARKSQSNDNDQNLRQMSENENTASITNFRFFQDSSCDKNNLSDEKRERLITPDEMLQQMLKKADSTMSLISEHVDFGKFASIMKRNPELDDSRGNKYDVPKGPPKEMSLEGETSLFSIIKSKIYSIFRDDDDVKESDSNTSLESDED